VLVQKVGAFNLDSKWGIDSIKNMRHQKVELMYRKIDKNYLVSRTKLTVNTPTYELMNWL
jgi:hypothetical protein